MKSLNWKPKEIFMTILGSTIFAVSVNLFLQPLNLYAGGFVGLAQLLRTLFFPNLTGIDIAGIINLCLNIPLFILAYQAMKRKMFFGTLLSLAIQTVLLTMVKIPTTPILNDTLAGIVVSGFAGGVGCGIVLTSGASAGGLDLLGVYLAQKKKGFSVGRMNLGFNIVLYTVCAILFDLQTALYSVIWIAVFSLAIDRFHYQNIEIELMIFTHDQDVKEKIMKKYVRGVTCWQGEGAYTKKGTEILVTVVAKSEVNAVKQDIMEMDPNAFIIVHSSVDVTGGYQKRLI
ncbi:MAG: YitT family protein [Solobacterium sp.]|jgi:uncharacterized membrane-anchored protein YitT (DUF2179 family)|nr:YitT family protein [Solobacterium sp.]